MRYLDVNLILSEEERLPVTFESQAYGLGHLDTNSNEQDLPAKSKIELPVWLAQVLSGDYLCYKY